MGIDMLFKSFALWVILIIVTGCSKVATIEEVTGMYSVKNGIEGNLLTIKSDSMYVHQFKSSKNNIQTFTGDWTIDKEPTGKLRITFSSFQFSPRQGQRKPIGIWSTIVEKESGIVILCFDLDIPISDGCFAKKDTL